MKKGDVLYSPWGCEQTNIDFYEVTKATGKTVTVQKIKTNKLYTGDMTGLATPITGSYEGAEIRRKVIQYGSSIFISLTSYSNAYPYDGIGKVFSSYA